MTEVIAEKCKQCGGEGFGGGGTICDKCNTGAGACAPITDLVIIKNIQEFEWNLAEVKQKIKRDIKKYVGLVVTDGNLKEMEQAQKEITSIRTNLDGFRKEVKKKLEKPYKLFEGEIKELLQLIEEAETPLKDQTLKYEKQRVAAKEVELNKFAQATALSMGVRNNYFNFAVQSQWTNRTAKDPAVRKEIVGLIEAMLDAQRRADELVEMEKQRVGLIEGQCLAHSALLKTPVVPADVNHLLVGVKLSDIPGIILSECQKRADMEAKAAADIEARFLAKAAAENVVEPPQLTTEHLEGTDQHPVWENNGINYQEEYISPPPLPPISSEILKPASFTLPPMPPMPPRNYPPAPSQPWLFRCVIEYPNITGQEASAIKEFLSERAISYNIISQEPIRSEF